MPFRATLFVSLLTVVCGAAWAQNDIPRKKPKTAASASAPAEPNRDSPVHTCTTAPRSEWITEDEMKLLAQHRGYRIKTFKVAKGNCYEVYGFDKTGRIVEAYFNPVTSQLVRQNIAQ
jgi:hypothetical protein